MTKLYHALGRLVAVRVNGVLSWVGTDHLGGTIRVADAAFTPVTNGRQRYTAYGQDASGTASLGTDHKYTGQIEDASTGTGGLPPLYWYASRAYDPGLGRFCQPDSIVPSPGDPQSLNRYAYALNNPLKYTDPSGHVYDDPGDWEDNSLREDLSITSEVILASPEAPGSLQREASKSIDWVPMEGTDTEWTRLAGAVANTLDVVDAYANTLATSVLTVAPAGGPGGVALAGAFYAGTQAFTTVGDVVGLGLNAYADGASGRSAFIQEDGNLGIRMGSDSLASAASLYVGSPAFPVGQPYTGLAADWAQVGYDIERASGARPSQSVVLTVPQPYWWPWP